MPGYTKARTEEIHAAARQLVAAVGGVEVLDAMTDLEARQSVLVGLAKQLATNEGITYKTARQHIAKACRRMRTPTDQSQQSSDWGGQREGAGRKTVKTIDVKFEKSDLPKWAQNHPQVLDRCKNDYTFRCNVMKADAAMRVHLIKETEEIYN